MRILGCYVRRWEGLGESQYDIKGSRLYWSKNHAGRSQTPELVMCQADCKKEEETERKYLSTAGRKDTDDEVTSESVKVCRVDKVGCVLGWGVLGQWGWAHGIPAPTKWEAGESHCVSPCEILSESPSVCMRPLVPCPTCVIYCSYHCGN